MELRQFDVIYVDLAGKVGSEQSGYRPAVIIQNDLGNKYCPTVVVLPLTTSIKKLGQPTHVIIRKDLENGLSSDSMLLGESLTSLSKERVVKKIGHISNRKEQGEIIGAYISNVTGYKENAKAKNILSMIWGFIKGGSIDENNKNSIQKVYQEGNKFADRRVAR